MLSLSWWNFSWERASSSPSWLYLPWQYLVLLSFYYTLPTTGIITIKRGKNLVNSWKWPLLLSIIYPKILLGHSSSWKTKTCNVPKNESRIWPLLERQESGMSATIDTAEQWMKALLLLQFHQHQAPPKSHSRSNSLAA